MPTEIEDKKLSDFETLTPDQEREVTLYNADGDVARFWHVRRFDRVVVVDVRFPGKAAKLESVVEHGSDWQAQRWVDQECDARAKRVPIIRKEKAIARLSKLIEDTKAPIEKLVVWSTHARHSYLFETVEELLKEERHEERLQKPREEQLSEIIEMLRKKGGDSYFKALNLGKHFIEQIRPGGLADQVIEGVTKMLEDNLIPWAYVAGHLGEKVVLQKEPRKLTVKLIEKHLRLRYTDLGFYPEGTTAKGLLDQLYRDFVEDVKPEVLDALTLE